MTNNTKLSTQPYKGTRDFLPEDFRRRQYLFDAWSKVCKQFGYEQYDTPILEPAELYRSKTSDEIVNEESFLFTDRGGREVMMRPEMTPSVSRIVAGKRQEMGYPLRLFSIPNCFRYERPQKGRLREFWQLNVDVFGVEGPEADAEMIQVADAILKELGASPTMYEIQISERGILDWLLKEKLGLNDADAKTALQLVDKKSKISGEDFVSGLTKLGVEQEEVNTVNSILKVENLDQLPAECQELPWFKNLQTVFKILAGSGIAFKFKPEIARGFDYYTGLVFEVFDTDPTNNRAMFGGGRYDGLVANFGVDQLPTTGFGMGDTVISEMLNARGLWPELSPDTDVMLLPIGVAALGQVGRFAAELRAEGKNVAIDYDVNRKLDKRIKSAEKLGIKQVGFIGEDELLSEQVTFKEI
jgi:histidyl-tRNA synthetase